MRLAAIDIGSNSLRILIEEHVPKKPPRALYRGREVIGLARGLRTSGLLQDNRLQKAALVLADFSRKLQAWRVERVKAVATEALRKALNKEEALSIMEKALGYPVYILSGAEEGRLSCLGARVDFSPQSWVVDVGGGSTEILGPSGEEKGWSLPLGAVTLSEQFGEEHHEEMVAYVQGSLQKALAGSDTFQNLTALGGTATNLASIYKGLTEFSEEQVHRTFLSHAWLEGCIHKLRAMSSRERSQVTGLEKGREDTIIPGACILLVLLEVGGIYGFSVSSKGILEGILHEFKKGS